MKYLALGLVFLGVAAAAQDYSVRDNETVLKGADLQKAIVEQKIIFFDNGESKYTGDGLYSYTYYQGQTAFGEYQISPDGPVCISFQNGFTRCDLFAQNDRGLVLLTEDGERYPVR